MSASKQLVGLLVAAVLASGCGSSADLRLRNGHVVKGPIAGSDQGAVYVEQDGEKRRVAREDIADVAHPGTGAMVVGGVLLGLAGVFAVKAEMAPHDCCGPDGTDCACYGPSEQSAGYMTAVLFALPGLGLETYGLLTYAGSRSRSASPTAAPSSPMQDAKGVRLRVQF